MSVIGSWSGDVRYKVCSYKHLRLLRKTPGQEDLADSAAMSPITALILFSAFILTSSVASAFYDPCVEEAVRPCCADCLQTCSTGDVTCKYQCGISCKCKALGLVLGPGNKCFPRKT
ncbi:hypothetical protein GDO81_024130 [Engystomops pustulosus]|uniref:TIL domain-containing protein n=1 Tax=Engystomops pustulosus TaxID=76066 RepID=A0AAV6ZN08_ENGPU|nr:hypothetical protein GDO81_024130 [Engystomops pustulosus]